MGSTLKWRGTGSIPVIHFSFFFCAVNTLVIMVTLLDRKETIMFNKTEIRIVVWGENEKVYVAKQLSSLHVKYNVVDEEKSDTEYHMRVNMKQLNSIINYIAPMARVYVSMQLYDGTYVYLAE